MRNASVEKGHVLAEGVVEYIVENIDDVEQESHWRAKFGRKVSDISKEIKALKDEHAKQLAKLKEDHTKQFEKLKEDNEGRHDEMMKLLMELKTASTA